MMFFLVLALPFFFWLYLSFLVLPFLFWLFQDIWLFLLFPNHSSLIASTGFIDMALRAGAKPASTPSTLISSTAATAIQKSI